MTSEEKNLTLNRNQAKNEAICSTCCHLAHNLPTIRDKSCRKRFYLQKLWSYWEQHCMGPAARIIHKTISGQRDDGEDDRKILENAIGGQNPERWWEYLRKDPHNQEPLKTWRLMRKWKVITRCIYMTFQGILLPTFFDLSQAKNPHGFYLSCDLPLHWTCVLKNPHLLHVKLIFVTQSAGLQRRLTQSQLQEQNGLGSPLQ